MSVGTIVLIVVGALLLLLIIVLWATYNGFVKVNARIDEAWADIGVQLKRRNDLFGNLVPTIQGYAKHEQGIMSKFAEARNAVAKAVQSGNLQDTENAEVSFGQAIQGMRMISEQYPDLKANQNFLQMQSAIEDTENKIQASRRFYNAGVQTLNAKVQMFPSNIIAKMFGFKAREMWDTKDHAVLDEGLPAENTKVAF